MLGIVGGVGPAATVLYYRSIIEGYGRLRKDQHYPEMIIYSLDMGRVTELFEAGRLDELADGLVKVVGLMKSGGCDLGLLACNSMHLVFDRVQSRVELPLVNLIETVVDEVRQRGWSKVGLMGTTFAMRSGLYHDPLQGAGIECLVPPEAEQDWIMAAILSDLQQAVVPRETTQRLARAAEELGSRGGEGVILGCTDLPAGLSGTDCDLPILDSTRIHVKRILELVAND